MCDFKIKFRFCSQNCFKALVAKILFDFIVNKDVPTQFSANFEKKNEKVLKLYDGHKC